MNRLLTDRVGLTIVNASCAYGRGSVGHTGGMRLPLTAAAAAAALFIGLAPVLQAQSSGVQKINHLVVIYQENWSFDSLYGRFPGANGIDNAGAAATQVDKNGEPYTTLPQPLNTTFNPPVPDPRFPADLANAPFEMSKFVNPSQQ